MTAAAVQKGHHPLMWSVSGQRSDDQEPIADSFRQHTRNQNNLAQLSSLLMVPTAYNDDKYRIENVSVVRDGHWPGYLFGSRFFQSVCRIRESTSIQISFSATPVDSISAYEEYEIGTDSYPKWIRICVFVQKSKTQHCINFDRWSRRGTRYVYMFTYSWLVLVWCRSRPGCIAVRGFFFLLSFYILHSFINDDRINERCPFLPSASVEMVVRPCGC